jgi:hypothetical protein
MPPGPEVARAGIAAQALALRARAFATTPASWHPTERSGTINQTRPTTRGGSTSSVRRGATANGRSELQTRTGQDLAPGQQQAVKLA